MELSKKERRELRREEKRQAAAFARRGRKFKTLAILCGAIFAVAAAGYFGYRLLSKTSQISDIGEVFPNEGTTHVADGTKVEYHTNPPSSGSHYGKAAEWGVHDKELQDEQLVHNLEHGGIWITYKLSLSPDEIKKLENLVKSYRRKVILTPREKNDSPIALVSWGRVYKMDAFDENVIVNYIKKYRNTGPEIVPD